MVPKFLAFTEGKPGSPALVREGNEKVLKARLEDALFYWREDLKTGIEGLADRLGSIVFVEGLGSLRDKAERLNRLGILINETNPAAERVLLDESLGRNPDQPLAHQNLGALYLQMDRPDLATGHLLQALRLLQHG